MVMSGRQSQKHKGLNGRLGQQGQAIGTGLNRQGDRDSRVGQGW
jgi:hypothetical protein